VERVNPARSLQYEPLVQMVINLNGNAGRGVEMKGLRMRRMRSEQVAVKFDLTVDVMEGEEGRMKLSLAYNRELWDGESVRRLGEHFGNMGRGVVGDVERKIESLPLLSAEEERQLLYEFNGGMEEYEVRECVHELLEAEALLSLTSALATKGNLAVLRRSAGCPGFMGSEVVKRWPPSSCDPARLKRQANGVLRDPARCCQRAMQFDAMCI